MKFKEKYINLLTDFGFKKIFGDEEFLMDFLNQVLPVNHQIKSLTFKKTEQLGGNKLDRNVIFDIYCISQIDERFVVEVQKAKQIYFKDRSIFYSTFPIQEQAKKGEWNFELKSVYLVAILDFEIDEDDKEQFCQIVQLKNDANRVFYDKLTLIFLELPKFRKLESELETGFEKWCYLLRHLSELKRRPGVFQEGIFRRLFKEAEIASFTEDERMRYERSLKNSRDYKNTIETAFIEGEIKGRAEGKVEGRVEVDLSAWKQGLTIKVIEQITGLSEKEVEKIKKQLQEGN